MERAASAPLMSFRISIGGANETAATTLFGLIFLFSLLRGFVHIRGSTPSRGIG
jgi:hypothetical protein